jgi:hypothetical protein
VLEGVLFLRGIAVQASTPARVRRRYGCLEPLEHLRQLPFEQLEFGDLLLNGAQLLRHERMQPGLHGEALPTVQLCRQCFERGEGEPECTRAANEQEPMHIVSEVLPVPCGTPTRDRHHAHVLIVANGFCWYAGGVRELADSQGSFHDRSSLCDVSGKKGTRSTCWKVKGKQAKKIAPSMTRRFREHATV